MKHHRRDLFVRPFSIITMSFAAIEVFPKECMGGLISLPTRLPVIVAAVPYQIAKRTTEEVETDSSSLLSSLRIGRHLKIGDFHSHPFSGRMESEPLAPSKTDFEDAIEGEWDLIVRIVRVRSSLHRRMREHGGSLSMSEGRFRILMRGYYRDKKDYKEVAIRICNE